jgi:hypothetical protein
VLSVDLLVVVMVVDLLLAFVVVVDCILGLSVVRSRRAWAGRPWLHGVRARAACLGVAVASTSTGVAKTERRRPERGVGLLLEDKRPRRRRERDSEPEPWTQPPQAESPSKSINCVGSATLRALAATGAARITAYGVLRRRAK